MDLQTGLCKGCYRTLEEIGRWGSMSDAERDSVLEKLPRRRSEAGRGSDVAEIPVPPLS
jgi:predicted Fe-S protein YdhL (DUF1289 family)